MPEPPIHTGVDHVHAHPRHTGHRGLDLVLALSAVFISAVSLYVAVEHGRIEQQLVQANSWPFLQAEGFYTGTAEDHVILVNAGIGPAKLESLQVFYRGKPVAGIKQLLAQCCGLPSDEAAFKAQFPEGIPVSDASENVIRPGERRDLMYVPGAPGRHQVADAFLRESSSITYRVCYCSVFDQCWLSSLSGLHPKEAQACPTGVRSFNSFER